MRAEKVIQKIDEQKYGQIQSETIEGNLILDLGKYEDLNYQFSNVQFLNAVTIISIPKNGYISFNNNCTFHSIFIIKLKHSHLGNANSEFYIEISDSIFKKKLTILSVFAIKAIELIGNTFHENLILKEIKNVDSIQILRNKIEYLFIMNLNSINSIIVDKNEFKYIDFVGVDCNIIWLLNNKLDLRTEIRESNIRDQLHIEKNESNKGLFINHTQIANTIIKSNNFKEDIQYNPFEISKVDKKVPLKSLQIESGNNGGAIRITGHKNLTTFEKIELFFNENSTCLFQIENLHTDILNISGTIKQSTVLIKELEAKRVSIDNFFNYSQLSLMKLFQSNNGVHLLVRNSILGKTNFINCSLINFDIIDVEGTILSEVTSSQTKWFNPIKLNAINYKTPERHLMNRDTFRQLKQAMYAQGDTIQAVEFKRYEMSEHLEVLNSTAIEKWSDAADRIMMLLNKSNSYGQNWLKAAVLSVLFTIFSYLIIASIHFQYQFPNSELYKFPECGFFYNSFDFIWQYKFNLFTLLDPTFSPEDIHFSNKETIKSSTILLLLTLHRIILAYLIFQTILAFRKYIK